MYLPPNFLHELWRIRESTLEGTGGRIPPVTHPPPSEPLLSTVVVYVFHHISVQQDIFIVIKFSKNYVWEFLKVKTLFINFAQYLFFLICTLKYVVNMLGYVTRKTFEKTT